MGKKQLQNRIEQPKITKWKKIRQHSYPKSLIFEIYISANNNRILAFLNISCVKIWQCCKKRWLLANTWLYFLILHEKFVKNLCFSEIFGCFQILKIIKLTKQLDFQYLLWVFYKTRKTDFWMWQPWNWQSFDMM